MDFSLGWNAASIGFVGILMCTLIEVWGFILQLRNIRRNKSEQSLSVYMLGYQLLFLLVSLLYGAIKPDLGIAINSGALAVCVLLVLCSMQKYRTFSPWEIQYGILLLVVFVAVLAFPDKELAFLLIFIGSIIAFLAQPLKIWRKKDSGVVEIKLLAVLFISSLFWVAYAFGRNNWALKIANPTFLAVLGLTILVWLRYRNPKYRKS